MCEISDKNKLRTYFKSARKALSADEKRLLDDKVCKQLMSIEEYQTCDKLLVYVSSEIEVSTISIIENALKDKNVYCPKCINGTNQMEFYRIDSFGNLSAGAYGILEPKSDGEKYSDSDNSVCLIPALSYDLKGFRLGFGKGYYDRFLADFSGIKIGLCYADCIMDKLPHDDYDIGVNLIVSDSKILRF